MNYLILAMKRSGSHAIMNWIQAHTKQEIYNNCCFGWEDKKLLTMKGMKEAKNGIANIEDFNYDDWEKYDFPSFPFVQECKIVVVLRSANNWLASCYQRRFSKDEEQRDVYKYLFKEYINDRKKLSPPRVKLYLQHLRMVSDLRKDPSNLVPITFDDWFMNKGYRRYLALMLEFDFKEDADAKKKYVAMYGKGSSFDGMKYDLEAENMNVLDRFEQLKDDPEFKIICDKAFDILKEGVEILVDFDIVKKH